MKFSIELLEKERKSGKQEKYESGFQNDSEKRWDIRRYPDGTKYLTIFYTMMSDIIIKLLSEVIGVHIPPHCIQISVNNAFPNKVL